MSGPELTAEGGPIAIVLIGLALALATIVIGAWVAVRLYRGYRRSGNRSVLCLAVGIALATTVHTATRVILSTVNTPLLQVNSIAIAIQFTGLVFVLYAVYGDPTGDVVRVAAGGVAGGAILLFAPLLLADVGTVSPPIAMTLANGATATLGAFIAVQAYRGYHRYNNRAMLLLAAGIGLLTVGSFVVLNVPTARFTDALRIGAVLTVELAGLLSIAVSFRVE